MEVFICIQRLQKEVSFFDRPSSISHHIPHPIKMCIILSVTIRTLLQMLTMFQFHYYVTTRVCVYRHKLLLGYEMGEHPL